MTCRLDLKYNSEILVFVTVQIIKKFQVTGSKGSKPPTFTHMMVTYSTIRSHDISGTNLSITQHV